jgi:RNA polymerase sigma factor (sigma-70 family)
MNPFKEKYSSENSDEALIKRAIEGDKKSLDSLIRRHQNWIYNIALRMVFNPEEAKDATQEILLKIITKLSSFEGRSSFKTWAYRISINHLLNMKKSLGEQSHTTSFDEYANIINNCPDNDLPDRNSVPVDLNIIIEEVKVSCMFGMLLCLNREQRIVYILGSIFAVTDKIGSEILNISRDNFRQKLARARKDLYHFMTNQCGLVNPENPCRCSKKTKVLLDCGYVNANSLKFNTRYMHTVQQAAGAKFKEFQSFTNRKCGEEFLRHPFQEAPDFVEILTKVLNDTEFKGIFNLN